MGVGLNATLEMSKNTLLNTQVFIQTASHNIANADSKTYARQKVFQVTWPPYRISAGYLGAGATLDRIVQQRDDLIEHRLMDSIAYHAGFEARAARLSTASAYLSDNGELGISQALGAFWDAWETLAQNPNDLAQQTAVTQKAANLASIIQNAHSQTSAYAADLETELAGRVEEVNGLMSQIAEYNHHIVRSEYDQVVANDLRDKRFQALTELAEFIPIQYQEQDNGSITITLDDFGSSITLVAEDQAGSLQYDTANHRITFTDDQGTGYPAAGDTTPNSFSAGELGGLMSVYHDLTQTYLDRLDTFASEFIAQVNLVHQQGGGSSVFSGGGASDIDVDTLFTVNPSQALAITDLQNTEFGALGTATFQKYLSDLQARIGLDQSAAASQSDFYAALTQHLEAQQQSVSGVSIDEEMVDLLKFQQIYQAAAKIIEKTSEMLDTVISMV
jgi:flagellar hook-associated protein FlgK